MKQLLKNGDKLSSHNFIVRHNKFVSIYALSFQI